MAVALAEDVRAQRFPAVGDKSSTSRDGLLHPAGFAGSVLALAGRDVPIEVGTTAR